MALPPDVRKVYDFPVSFQLVLWGYAPVPLRRSLKENLTGLAGKAKPFRTSGGQAAQRSVSYGTFSSVNVYLVLTKPPAIIFPVILASAVKFEQLELKSM